MKFLVDENLPNAILTELSAKGLDAVKVLSGSSDQDVAALAQKDQRVLLTLDKDFANILIYPREEYFGIICFRIKRPLIKEIIIALDSTLEHFDSESLTGKLIVVTEKGFRIR